MIRIYRMKDSHTFRWGNSLLQQISSVLFQVKINIKKSIVSSYEVRLDCLI